MNRSYFNINNLAHYSFVDRVMDATAANPHLPGREIRKIAAQIDESLAPMNIPVSLRGKRRQPLRQQLVH